jgi:hypothetical protein
MYAPPAQIDHVESAVVQYLEGHSFTLQGPISIRTMQSRRYAGMALPAGEILLDRTVSSLADNDAELPALLLHETLHETLTGGAGTAMTHAQFVANEQATESTALDLLPGLLRSMGWGRRAVSDAVFNATQGSAYWSLVRKERMASATICHAPWTSRCARGVRAGWFLTPPAQRLAPMSPKALYPLTVHIAAA